MAEDYKAIERALEEYFSIYPLSGPRGPSAVTDVLMVRLRERNIDRLKYQGQVAGLESDLLKTRRMAEEVAGEISELWVALCRWSETYGTKPPE